ncbi:glycoside hydrolase family 95 protein [Pedobacter heparinus]|uniref:glycoside hydrolase family 95 protein n=1 Tax=Pedobacter heparinus TaxID=984 RepID=UPI00292E4A14|nr:glycoside hydrolase family 95 protein [Pedobacter heparinus]
MKFVFLLTLLCAFKAICFGQENNALKLRYAKPASQFEEALPVGNGRLAAMIYGGVKTERISLNEGTLWSGGPVDATKVNPTAHTYLKPVRAALFNENYKKADSLMRFMQGPYSEAYMPLGNLNFDFNFTGTPKNFSRELDIQNAIAKVSYEVNGTSYTRETFISHPDQVILFKLTAKGKDKLNFSCNFNSKLLSRGQVKANALMMKGWAPVHTEPNYRGNIRNAIVNDTSKAMRFVSILKVLKTDGKQRLSDTSLYINNATEVVLVLSMATSFNGFDKAPGLQGKDEVALATAYLNRAFGKDYQILKTRHTKDFRKYFDRVSIQLGDTEFEKLSTTERLNRFATGKTDNSLIALFYQYSRYLLISSSRPGGQATNLQALWNEMVRPPWSSNYTLNINTQMNYWGAETGNLTEMHQPLMDFIGRIAKTGAITAKNYYQAEGWVSHHNSDLWAISNPVGDYGQGHPCWANWQMSGVWLSTHLWEHFAFTNDKAFLKNQAYALMKGAVDFCLSFLVADKQGYLVTAPSTSPENIYISLTGYKGATLYGSTADMAMIRELFVDYLKASEILQLDAATQLKVKAALAKLPPYRIGKKGNLQEWYYDWDDAEPKHRHVSHLFSLYPGQTITTYGSPALSKAVQKTLEIKTNESTGWAITWRINLWARLQNGAMAYNAITKLFRNANDPEVKKSGEGGLYENLLSTCPPFQIDANFGGGAGIAEMLLQSHQGYIELLPALPAEWPKGEVKGLVARGGYVMDMGWKDGQLNYAKIFSRNGGNCEVKYGAKIKKLSTMAGQTYHVYF